MTQLFNFIQTVSPIEAVLLTLVLGYAVYKSVVQIPWIKIKQRRKRTCSECDNYIELKEIVRLSVKRAIKIFGIREYPMITEQMKVAERAIDRIKILLLDDFEKQLTLSNKEAQTRKLELLAGEIRMQRNELLKETDYIVMPDYPLEDKSEWIKYRQALRDITKQSGFPENIIWPEKPEK